MKKTKQTKRATEKSNNNTRGEIVFCKKQSKTKSLFRSVFAAEDANAFTDFVVARFLAQNLRNVPHVMGLEHWCISRCQQTLALLNNNSKQ